ncbi:MAG: ABC transporter ATP-binding protein [Devosia sp.]|nr:ABC transporter ATP-binding protein [Devosia sp.]
MATAPHIEVDDLTIMFRTGASTELAAVEGVSFRVQPGETVGIVGESGCGKSTLARALLAYLKPGARLAGGSVRVADNELFGLSPRGLARYRGRAAALVPQNPLSSLTPHRTIEAHLTELIGLHAGLTGAARRERALELLAAMELPDPPGIAARYPHELSGGQRQRVVIAAALVANPGLIVLDGPTTALDKTVEAQVLSLVSSLQAKLNTTLVYVSHDLNVVARMCRRVLVMRNGRLIEDGPVAQVFHRPRTAYARTLVDAIPRLEARVPVADTPDSAVDVRDLQFRYRTGPRWWLRLAGDRSQPVLDELQFSIPRGRTLGVVGESGSGKSTLAKLIAGLASGHEGSIRFEGTTVAGLARDRDPLQRRRIQMIFQDPLSSLNPRHTVEELISRPLQIQLGLTMAAARERVVRWLEELDLPTTLLTRLPRMLSGGQQQRVAIARAFASEPDVVLCDEITSALDVTVQAQVLGLMQRLQRQHGTTYLFISHDLPVVAQVSDALMVLRNGRIEDYGPTGQVIAAPRSPYTAELLAAFRPAELHIPDREPVHVD